MRGALGVATLCAALAAPLEPQGSMTPPTPFTLPGQKEVGDHITTSVTEGCGGVCQGKGCPNGWRPVGDKTYTKQMNKGVKALTGTMMCKCICIQGSNTEAPSDTDAADKSSAEAEKFGAQELNQKGEREVSKGAAANTTTVVAIASAGPNPAGELYGQCTFVANLHVRKCGGTSVRELFTGMEGWQQSGQDKGLGYCSSMKEHAEAAVPGQKKWIEIHCEENLRTFNKGVALLREKMEPLGCKVVSSLLLRNPVEQGISEWLYFFKDQVDGMRESQNPLDWTSDYMAWAKAHSEEELRLLTSPDSVTPVDNMIWEKDSGNNKGTPLPLLLSCDAAVSMAKEEMAKVDVVATMDTPDEFAAFWMALGRKAGFEPLSEKAEELFNTHGDTDKDPDIKAEERELIMKANGCSLRVTDMARTHMAHVDTTLINGVAIQDDVSKLLTKWGGSTRVAQALKERERPAGMMAKLAMSFSNSSMLKPKA